MRQAVFCALEEVVNRAATRTRAQYLKAMLFRVDERDRCGGQWNWLQIIMKGYEWTTNMSASTPCLQLSDNGIQFSVGPKISFALR